MKKMFFFLVVLLGVVSCCPEEEMCSVTTEYIPSQLTVTPRETLVSKGKTVAINLVEAQGYQLIKVTVNGDDTPIINGTNGKKVQFVAEEDSHVSFFTKEVKEYSTVNVTSTIGGTVSPSGTVTVEKDHYQYFEVKANSGYFVDSVYIDNIGKKVANTESYYYPYRSVDTKTHELRITFVKRKVYSIIVQSDEYITCTQTGITDVYEGSNFNVSWSTVYGCSSTAKVDGVDITGNSYTFENVTSNHVIDLRSKKEAEWYLCRGTWSLDSSYLNNLRFVYNPSEKYVFYPNGTYNINGKNNYHPWNISKSINETKITFTDSQSTGKIIIINEQKMYIYYEGVVDGEFRSGTDFYNNTK